MANDAKAVLQEIRTALAGVSGLSADRVRRGTWQGAKPVAGGATVWVSAGALASDYGDDLTSYRRTLTVQCVVLAPADGADYGTREDAVLDLIDPCIAAIEQSALTGPFRTMLRSAPRTLASGLLMVDGMLAPAAAFTVECSYLAAMGDGL